MAKRFTVTKTQFKKMIAVLGFKLVKEQVFDDSWYYYAVRDDAKILLRSECPGERVDWRNALVDLAWSKQ